MSKCSLIIHEAFFLAKHLFNYSCLNFHQLILKCFAEKFYRKLIS